MDGKDSDEEAPRASVERSVSEAVLKVDDVFDALSHSRRRYLLYSLCEATERELPDIAGEIVAFEGGVPSEAADSEDVQTVLVSLYHTHLPKLAESDFLAFDRESGTISRGERTGEAIAVLTGMSAGLESYRASSEDDTATGISDGPTTDPGGSDANSAE